MDLWIHGKSKIHNAESSIELFSNLFILSNPYSFLSHFIIHLVITVLNAAFKLLMSLIGHSN